MVKEALPQSLRGDASAHQPFYSEVVSDEIPMTEHGIALLPGLHSCIGESCPHRRQRDECYVDRDHLHHSRVYYENHSALAAEWRDLDVLQSWVHRCVHDQKHADYPFNVPVPSPKVMQECIKEEAVLREIKTAHKVAETQEAYARRPDIKPRQRDGAYRAADRAKKEKIELLKSVDNIEFLPQEIVTGFLLMVSPGHAQNRMFTNRNVILPSLVGPAEIGAAWDEAETIIAKIDQKNRVLRQGRQLDEEFIEAVARAA